jgi:ABC-type branched-subunit amino acid transport system substrate-binding protein
VSGKSKALVRVLALTMALALLAAACGDSDDNDGGASDANTATTTAPVALDYEAIGLWDDGPCDTARKPLIIGLMTVFESPVLTLKDQATALEESAKAFNARGGANGACIEVHTCDDGGTAEKATRCARTIEEAGVHVTVNDQGTAAQAEVSTAMADAGIPRLASNVTQNDWSDQNAYPLDASGTGSVFIMPSALIASNVKKIGLIRVDLPEAAVLGDLLEDTYGDEGVEFVSNVPVPAGTTDFNQFILGAQDEGAEGVILAAGEQEAVQVVRAGQQLSTPLRIGGTLGTFSHESIAELGDFAKQMDLVWSFPPATFDLPVYQALRADLAASGNDALQPENLKASPMRSWIGLYALLKMIRDADLQEFTRPAIKNVIEKAKDVPMLDIFAGENWTPDTDHAGIYKRAGTNHWATWTWDPDAPAPDGLEGNFVKGQVLNYDEVLCGSPFGAPAETC